MKVGGRGAGLVGNELRPLARPARTSGLDLTSTQTDYYKMGMRKTPIAAGHCRRLNSPNHSQR